MYIESREIYEYHNWWKIGVALLNSFPREIAETLFLGWSKKDLKYSGEDIETDIAEKLD